MTQFPHNPDCVLYYVQHCGLYCGFYSAPLWGSSVGFQCGPPVWGSLVGSGVPMWSSAGCIQLELQERVSVRGSSVDFNVKTFHCGAPMWFSNVGAPVRTLSRNADFSQSPSEPTPNALMPQRSKAQCFNASPSTSVAHPMPQCSAPSCPVPQRFTQYPKSSEMYTNSNCIKNVENPREKQYFVTTQCLNASPSAPVRQRPHAQCRSASFLRDDG